MKYKNKIEKNEKNKENKEYKFGYEIENNKKQTNKKTRQTENKQTKKNKVIHYTKVGEKNGKGGKK